MIFLNPATLGSYAVLAVACTFAFPTNNAEQARSTETTDPCPCKGISPASREIVVSNWLKLWAGNYDYLNKTVTSDVQLYQDRFPTGTNSISMPIDNSSALLSFVKESRMTFETYCFVDDFHFGDDNLVALRWTLNATFAGSQKAWVKGRPGVEIHEMLNNSRTLKKGSEVTYNGTDLMVLNRCSGLIQQVLSAQDFITYFHVLGEPIGVVWEDRDTSWMRFSLADIMKK
jgi:hypothetical protein